jgi:hypothetical protein
LSPMSIGAGTHGGFVGVSLIGHSAFHCFTLYLVFISVRGRNEFSISVSSMSSLSLLTFVAWIELGFSLLSGALICGASYCMRVAVRRSMVRAINSTFDLITVFAFIQSQSGLLFVVNSSFRSAFRHRAGTR